MHECSPYSYSNGGSFTCITDMVFAGFHMYLSISKDQNVDKQHEASCKYVIYERLQLSCTCRKISAIADKLSKILRDAIRYLKENFPSLGDCECR